MKFEQKLFFGMLTTIVIFVLGCLLLPWSKNMFEFHDQTQAARIAQFAVNLQNFHIPPRMAPDFSYGMGYPVFNFYAPFAYWVGGVLSLLGLTTIGALKVSFLLALIGMFFGMYAFLRELFEESSALLGATLYVTSSVVPLEIFVRGNLAEMWFMALFPLALYLLIRNTRERSRKVFVITSLVLSFLLTVHNVLSLLALVLVVIFIQIHEYKSRNYLALFLGALAGSYFLIPALFESRLTYATTVATMTNYADHFLCAKQLWKGTWGFGGSVPGCISDGMSFALGKLQWVLGIAGGATLMVSLYQKRTTLRSYIARSLHVKVSLFVALLTGVSLFLTLEQSAFAWKLAAPVLALFQFPWRFIVFGVFGLAYFGAFGSNFLRVKLSQVSERNWGFVLFAISIGACAQGYALFNGQSINNTLYESMYVSDSYIRNSVAYKIPEYLPRTVDYAFWRSFEDKNAVPYSEGQFKKQTLDIHYFPYWQILVDGKVVVPTEFDNFGRPKLIIPSGSKLEVIYKQSTIEMFGNWLTLASVSILVALCISNALWIRIKKIES